MATTDDPDVMDVHIQSATDIARRFGDTDLHFCALGYRALSLVLRGQIADGMSKVDEAATAAATGEVRDYLAIGEIYCRMLLCCELTLDVRRADQWLAEVESFDTRTNAPWVSAICRTHYGGILTAAGRWTDAEQELAESVRLYDLSYRALRSSALVAEGLSNEHIAKRLFISKRTVEHHIGNILGKLGLDTRAEAIAYLQRHGTP